jgi:uncharacterized protein (UPF0332 family)
MQDSVRWCAELKDGLKLMQPDDVLARSYLKEAWTSLKRAEKNFKDGDLLWATVVAYYAEYYALYSFLQKIGAKCENHFCSIVAAENLLGPEKTRTIKEHKEKRTDAQYYMRIGKESQIIEMLRDAKVFVSDFDVMVSKINREETDAYRKKLKSMMNGTKTHLNKPGR